MFAGVRFLPAGGDDDVLLAAGDRQVAVVVDRTEVASVQPAVLDGAEACVGVVVIAGEDVRSFDEDLAVVGDPQLDAGSARPTVPKRWFSTVEVVAAVAVSVIP